jgi:alkylation response protein AidB-like acyl-CoA dehydrogenase
MIDVICTMRVKYWWTGWKTSMADLSRQLFASQGYRNEYSILPQYRAAPFRRPFAGTHEIMKAPTASSL